MKRPYPTTPFALTPQVTGEIYINPSESVSKSSFGRVFDGGACNDAGPTNAVPDNGSYILP